jgi:hypothetical protein
MALRQNSANTRELIVNFVFRRPCYGPGNAVELLAGTADFVFVNASVISTFRT